MPRNLTFNPLHDHSTLLHSHTMSLSLSLSVPLCVSLSLSLSLSLLSLSLVNTSHSHTLTSTRHIHHTLTCVHAGVPTCRWGCWEWMKRQQQHFSKQWHGTLR
jgi:hypothetical protein